MSFIHGDIIDYMEREFYFFHYSVSEDEIRREKAKARRLRQTRWWRQKKSRGVCHYCGKKTDPSELTMDHLIPLTRGGKSIKANLVPACKECNNRKKYMLPMEWQEYLSGLKESILED